MPRVVLRVQYDGRDWSGWQSQPGGRTVQDILEKALSTFIDAPVRSHAAGRTDSGVHATGQVVHFDCQVDRPLAAWVRGVNRYLPSSIAVRSAVLVPESFHARFSAMSRSYCYVLYTGQVRAPHLSGRAGWEFRPLRLEPMRQAAAMLIGEHDFSAFRSVECQAKSPVKTMHQFDITRRGQMLVFELRANAFLHHMVRNLVGSLLYVGQGKHQPDYLAQLLSGRDRSQAAPTFMADGLYLTAVEYPAEFKLPEGEALDLVFPGLLP
jgi:tRNA pseudouridine38-40 synthase